MFFLNTRVITDTTVAFFLFRVDFLVDSFAIIINFIRNSYSLNATEQFVLQLADVY